MQKSGTFPLGMPNYMCWGSKTVNKVIEEKVWEISELHIKTVYKYKVSIKLVNPQGIAKVKNRENNNEQKGKKRRACLRWT